MLATSPCGRVILVRDTLTGELRSELTLKTKHSCVRMLKFSSDGTHLASATGIDGFNLSFLVGREFDRSCRNKGGDLTSRMIYIWDLETWTLKMTLPAVLTDLVTMCFSPDNNSLFTVTSSALQCWDVRDASMMYSFELKGKLASVTALSPDGKLLGLYDISKRHQPVKLMDTSTGKIKMVIPVKSLRRLKSRVDKLEFSSDGKRLFVVCGTKSLDDPGVTEIGIWDLASRSFSKVYSFPDRIHDVDDREVLFSGNLALECYNEASKIQILDIDTGRQEPLLRSASKCLYSFAFAPDGKQLVSDSFGTLRVWDLEVRCGGSEDNFDNITKVARLALSSDGETLVSAMQNERVIVWSTSTAQMINTFHIDSSKHLDFLPDSSEHLLSLSEYQVLRFWHLRSGDVFATFQSGPSYVTSRIVISPNKKYLAFTQCVRKSWGARDIRPVVTVYNLEKTEISQIQTMENVQFELKEPVSRRIPFYLRSFKMIFSTDSKSLMGVGFVDGLPGLTRITIWNLETRKATEVTHESNHDISGIACFNVNSESILAVASGSGTSSIFFMDQKTGSLLRPFKLSGHDSIDQIRGGLINRILTKKFIPFPDGQVADNHRILMEGFVPSPDGQLVATFSWKSLILWDTATGNCVKEIEISNATKASFSSDGSLIETDCGWTPILKDWTSNETHLHPTRGLRIFKDCLFQGNRRRLWISSEDIIPRKTLIKENLVMMEDETGHMTFFEIAPYEEAEAIIANKYEISQQ